MNKNKLPDNQITIYQAPDGNINIEVICANENIWLPQKRMAELFGCSVDNISLHLKNIYKEQELDESATIEDYSTVQIEGNRRVTEKKMMTNLITDSEIQKSTIELLEKQGFQYFYTPCQQTIRS